MPPSLAKYNGKQKEQVLTKQRLSTRLCGVMTQKTAVFSGQDGLVSRATD
jgi:hypothetical protein